MRIPRLAGYTPVLHFAVDRTACRAACCPPHCWVTLEARSSSTLPPPPWSIFSSRDDALVPAAPGSAPVSLA